MNRREFPITTSLQNGTAKQQIFRYALRPGESLRAGLLRLVDRLVQNVIDRFASPGRDRNEGIHSIRTTINRLRAIMRLIQSALSETAFEREDSRLRLAAHRLCLTRDRQVVRQTLPTLAVSKNREQEAVDAALAGLEAEAHPQTSIDEAMKQVAADLEQARLSFRRL